MQIKITLLLWLFTATLCAQDPMTYVNHRNETHLCGPISIEDLNTSPYKKWFNKNYKAMALSEKPTDWKDNLKETQVDIFLGTWCGDSKRNVPKFIKLWESLGLDPSQLNIIALYDSDEKYKQGPNREEMGKGIHRVPTFIFHKDGEEYARIVERPVTDLETDLAQIALGVPSTPNYQAASYMIKLFANNSPATVDKDLMEHATAVNRLTNKSRELNTLGHVFMSAGKIQEALLTFQINTKCFQYEPKVFNSYAEALAFHGQNEQAVANYKKVLELDPDNNHAKTQISKLEEKG